MRGWSNPTAPIRPDEMLGSKVTGIRNFETDTIGDVEGDVIPKEKMSDFRTRQIERESRCGLGNGAKDQVLPFRPAPAGERKI